MTPMTSLGTPSHSLYSNYITTGLTEVIENPLLYIETTLHGFYDRYHSKCLMLAVNISDEELRINTGIIMFCACG